MTIHLAIGRPATPDTTVRASFTGAPKGGTDAPPAPGTRVDVELEPRTAMPSWAPLDLLDFRTTSHRSN